jgi:hypothetical protein
LCLFTNSNNCCMRVYHMKNKTKKWLDNIISRGLDNKLTLYPLNIDDDANKYKKVVATHANYISACKFMHSDQQVIHLIYSSGNKSSIFFSLYLLAFNRKWW